MKKIYNLLPLVFLSLLTFWGTLANGQNVPAWIPTNGLVAYYPLNGNTDDASGNQLNGTAFGSSNYVTDRSGNANAALSFNGFNNHIEIADDPKLRFRNGTIIYWLKTTAVTKQTIVAKSTYANSSNEMYASTINDPFNGHVIFGVKYNSNCSPNQGWRFNSSNVNVNDGQWQMIAFTIRPDSLIIYKNGQKINAVTSNLSRIDSCVGGTLRIGRNWANDNRYFNGDLDDLAFYNRPLSQQEILNIYQGCPVAPVVTVVGSTSICSGDTVQLISSALNGNTWSNGDTNRIIRVAQAGTYFTSITNLSCTANSLPITITVTPRPATPVITPSGPTTFCSGGSLVLTSSSTTGNLWSNTNSGPSITVTTSGIYSVSVSNGICSSASLPVVVTVNPTPPTPTINVTGPTTFCQGGSVTLTSSSFAGNTWSNNSNSQSIQATTSGNYTVTVTLGSCSATSNPVNVNVLPGVTITNQPSNINGFVASSARFVVNTMSSSNVFQWQTNIGFGFQNVSNAGQYNGANNDTLEVSNLSLSNHNQLFRCIITQGTCADTTNEATLSVTTGVNTSQLSIQPIEVYPNPTQSTIMVQIGMQDKPVAYQWMSVEGKIIQSGFLKSGLNTLSLEYMPKGVYFLRTWGHVPGWAKVIRN